jgi:hypothetical protein
MSRRRRQRASEPTILDAIRLGILPDRHRIAAIAAAMLNSGHYFTEGKETPHTLVSMIADSDVQAEEMAASVLAEMERQLKLRSKRLAKRRYDKKQSAMGKQLDKDERVNRLCQTLFGDPSKWLPAGPVSPQITKPFFTWFTRAPDDVLVAGVEGLAGTELVTGFVFNVKKGSKTRFAKLPSSARNMESLLRFLGLHPRLASSKSIKIDWMRRTFVIDGTNHLPWVYP